MGYSSDNDAAIDIVKHASLSHDALLIALNQQQQKLLEQERLNAELQARVDDRDGVIEDQQLHIKSLEEKLRLALFKRFAPSSEKSAPGQGELFNEAEQLLDADAAADHAQPEPERTQAVQKKGGRKGLNPDLPRERIEHRLSDAEREGAVDTFFTKVKEELHIEPAKACVHEHWHEKAVYEDHGERSVVVATRSKHPLGKCIASVELLAWIIVAKYADGLPLHRLESILKRYGGEITRTAMATWVIRLAERLEPLLSVLYQHQRRCDYLQIDETRIQVHKEKDADPRSQKYMWVMRGGPPGKAVVRFHYDPSRSQAVVNTLLDGFEGRYVQSDGYAAYVGATESKNLIHLGCWDHARRKFKEAEKAQPKGSKQKEPSKATMALSLINALYRIEREIAELDSEERYEQRQGRSLKALAKLKTWLDTHHPKVSPDSLVGKAISYTLNQWATLTRYTEHGDLHISNCLAENAIRPFVVGRKAWMFAGTPSGAKASACFYTLVETAKANGIEPYAYLSYVIKHITGAETEAELSQLLPWAMR